MRGVLRRAALRPPAQEVLTARVGCRWAERRTHNVERRTRNVADQNARRKMQKRTGLPFCVFRLAFFVLWAASACSPSPPPADLRRLTLPDLSHASPSVQEQLREGYAALDRSIGTRDIRPVDLGDAYGRMGMLLMAAEFRNEAESALLNAEALSPARAPLALLPGARVPPQGRRGEVGGRVRAGARAAAGRPADARVARQRAARRGQAGGGRAAFRRGAGHPAPARHRRARPRTGGARAPGLRARRGRARTRAVSRSEGDDRSLPARARLPRPRRRRQGDRAHAAARDARHQARRSAHARARQPAAQRARVRGGRRRRPRQGGLGRRGGQFPEGHRPCPRGAVAPPQAGHRPGAQRRHTWGGGPVRAGPEAVAHFRQGALQPRPHPGVERPVAAGGRTLGGRDQGGARLRGAAPPAGRRC